MYLPYDTVGSQADDSLKSPAKRRSTGAVFEELSDDYNAVRTHFPPAPPTISERLEQLPSILPPHTAYSSSVFEEESPEYAIQTPTASTSYTPNPSAATLRSLLLEKKLSAANALLDEMLELNASIPPSDLYEDAALEVLRSGSSPEDKLDQFTKWFSLIPPIHDFRERDFEELRHWLLEAPNVNLPLLECCSLILSSKGFGDSAVKSFLPPIFTYLPPDRLMQFIADLESRNAEYWKGQSLLIAGRRIRYTSENLRGLAVRCLVYNNRVDEAMTMLPAIHVKTYGFTLLTYDVLLRKLRETPDLRWRGYISRVETLRAARQDLERERGLSPDDTVTRILPPLPARTSLALTLRYLRTYISYPDPHRTLPAIFFSFMSDYLAKTSGRTFAMRLLLRKALCTGHLATKRVVWAEMRLYRKLGRPDMVIRTFVEHFWVDGVPRREVARYYDAVLHEERQRRPSNDEASVERITGFTSRSRLPVSKMWPDLEQCTAVWEALILLTGREPRGDLRRRAFLELYGKFIEYAKSAPPPSPDAPAPDPSISEAYVPSPADAQPTPHPSRFAIPVAPETFHAFMHHLMRDLGPVFGRRVINDMRAVGLWPGVYHWSWLAQALAKKRQTQEVWRIIDAVEDGSIMEWARTAPADEDPGPLPAREPLAHTPTRPTATAAHDVTPSPHHSPSAVPLHMRPDRAFYISIIEGFIYAKDTEQASEVCRRLIRRFSIADVAEYPAVARVMQKLRDLEGMLARQGVQAVKGSKPPVRRHRQSGSHVSRCCIFRNLGEDLLIFVCF